jgi:hypothetical protein
MLVLGITIEYVNRNLLIFHFTGCSLCGGGTPLKTVVKCNHSIIFFMNLRHFSLSTIALISASVLCSHPAIASYEKAAEIARDRGVNLDSIVAKVEIRENETYPDINQELYNQLLEVQSSGKSSPASQMFWGLAEFTKQTGITVKLPPTNSKYSEPEGFSNLSDNEINSILSILTKFKPYAIALNLNSPKVKVKNIEIYRRFRANNNAGGYNEGGTFVIPYDNLSLETLLHEMLHSVDPFQGSPENTRACMKIVFGRDVFERNISQNIEKKEISPHILRNSTISTGDATSGRLSKIRNEGLFLECFTVLGTNSLYISSEREESIKLFYKFIAALELNNPAYRTPEFVALFKELSEKGSRISEEDANRYSKIFQGFWLAVKQGDLTLDRVDKNVSEELKRAHKILTEHGFSRPKSWGGGGKS